MGAVGTLYGMRPWWSVLRMSAGRFGGFLAFGRVRGCRRPRMTGVWVQENVSGWSRSDREWFVCG